MHHETAWNCEFCPRSRSWAFAIAKTFCSQTAWEWWDYLFLTFSNQIQVNDESLAVLIKSGWCTEGPWKTTSLPLVHVNRHIFREVFDVTWAFNVLGHWFLATVQNVTQHIGMDDDFKRKTSGQLHQPPLLESRGCISKFQQARRLAISNWHVTWRTFTTSECTGRPITVAPFHLNHWVQLLPMPHAS